MTSAGTTRAAADLRALKRELKTWTAVAARLGLNVGLVYQVAKKGKHAPDTLMSALGYEVAPVAEPVWRKRRLPKPPAKISEWPTARLARALADRVTLDQGDHHEPD